MITVHIYVEKNQLCFYEKELEKEVFYHHCCLSEVVCPNLTFDHK